MYYIHKKQQAVSYTNNSIRNRIELNTDYTNSLIEVPITMSDLTYSEFIVYQSIRAKIDYLIHDTLIDSSSLDYLMLSYSVYNRSKTFDLEAISRRSVNPTKTTFFDTIESKIRNLKLNTDFTVYGLSDSLPFNVFANVRIVSVQHKRIQICLYQTDQNEIVNYKLILIENCNDNVLKVCGILKSKNLIIDSISNFTNKNLQKLLKEQDYVNHIVSLYNCVPELCSLVERFIKEFFIHYLENRNSEDRIQDLIDNMPIGDISELYNIQPENIKSSDVNTLIRLYMFVCSQVNASVETEMNGFASNDKSLMMIGLTKGHKMKVNTPDGDFIIDFIPFEHFKNTSFQSVVSFLSKLKVISSARKTLEPIDIVGNLRDNYLSKLVDDTYTDYDKLVDNLDDYFNYCISSVQSDCDLLFTETCHSIVSHGLCSISFEPNPMSDNAPKIISYVEDFNDVTPLPSVTRVAMKKDSYIELVTLIGNNLSAYNGMCASFFLAVLQTIYVKYNQSKK